MDLFPFIQPQVTIQDNDIQALPLYKEIAWDYEQDMPLFEGKKPKIVEGAEAVLTWAYKALNTERFKHSIYTWDFGNEASSLVGDNYNHDLKLAEAKRYIQECLTINPYITNVGNIDVSFADDLITITCTIDTIYGQINI